MMTRTKYKKMLYMHSTLKWSSGVHAHTLMTSVSVDPPPMMKMMAQGMFFWMNFHSMRRCSSEKLKLFTGIMNAMKAIRKPTDESVT